MRIGLFLALFGDKPLDDAVDIAQSLGLGAVEIGAAAYPGSPHLDVPKLLESKKERDALLKKLSDRRLQLSAVSVHGNAIHPDKALADDHHAVFENAVKLAAALGVDGELEEEGEDVHRDEQERDVRGAVAVAVVVADGEESHGWISSRNA